ncbi:hypothetical protein PHLGIDRAFT_103496 [Phlebiopsis gigantea 11061_1 CR5-6]|uniref:Bromo domain-containing protein n=1 Tax=Phlebiopsis gigantea (strain 11061_1 CR5-6) TaxID=745531 RepID=A0A0C3PPU6_PHLG1|nr:hypothetical protein PHLGIDRAFT_103496 [Phlebiopsis gigantea 11061_1 CR5-6]
MNNLLRTLTDSQQQANGSEPNLKLLLNAVKEARRQANDAKVGDAFYDSLDGLLQDVRMVTMDNRDAEAFLKPVLKSEVPDYYDVIMHPMDLQTMQKKVRQKQYKSKREFKDDLDLIYNNCLLYNANETHPLRQCVTRLRAKAEKLLKNITDRKERVEPPIPSDISRGNTPKLNGTVNGHVRPRPVALTKSPTPVKLLGPSNAPAPRRDAPFAETPAILRTAEGMSEFAQLDRELDARLQGEFLANGLSGPSLEEQLRYYAGVESEGDSDDMLTADGEVGEKRKINSAQDNRPRKRARFRSPDKDVVELWWDVMQTDTMIGNALPVLRYAASEDPSSSTPPKNIIDPPRKSGQRLRKKRRKEDERSQRTLLYHMNNNIRTVRRVRDTHARLTVLKETSAEDGSGAGGQPPEPLPPPSLDDSDDAVDDRPWRVGASGLDIGEQTADDCMHWMGSKVLEHAGFQGSSKVALDVLAGVTSDYLLNVGRTLRFLCDKYTHKMTSEEIILHTLFESGVTRIHDLERYVQEDIVRYGARMTDLEKKLRNAYTEATADQAWDDEALFKMEDDEEEDSEFVMGNFADTLGDDFLGLRELGIAAEFGLQSLSVPKKLLKGKNKGVKDGPAAANPSEPPPPFPPPPPFVPLDSHTVEDQIGLLQPYYHSRLAAVAGPSAQSVAIPPIPPPFGSHIPGAYQPMQYQPMAAPFPPHAVPLPAITLPDDTPTTVQQKLGPLGQVVKANPSAGTSKKKAPPKPKIAPDGGGGDAQLNETPAATPAATAPDTPRRPKPTPTKKKKTLDTLPPVIMAAG